MFLTFQVQDCVLDISVRNFLKTFYSGVPEVLMPTSLTTYFCAGMLRGWKEGNISKIQRLPTPMQKKRRLNKPCFIFLSVHACFPRVLDNWAWNFQIARAWNLKKRSKNVEMFKRVDTTPENSRERNRPHC